jgi:hypothetical protein
MCNILIYFCNTDVEHLKHIFATCAFSATSPCCLRMETCQCVEFIGVELTGGAEVAALVEKPGGEGYDGSLW